MRKLDYFVLPGVGPGKKLAHGDPVTLMFSIPYFMMTNIIPPKFVLNEVFTSALVDAGMSGGCEWTAFQIDDEEYLELTQELESLGFVKIETPEWVRGERDWTRWCMEMARGVPGQEMRELEKQIEEADKRFRQDPSLYSELASLSSQMMAFIDQHRRADSAYPLPSPLPTRLRPRFEK